MSESATIDYFDQPARYRCLNATDGLAGTNVSVPPFESSVDQIAAFARENPDVGTDTMA
ncbi:hypothetical protein [Halorubrum sp. HHNYT27]|uniref:hypothetical protein n=1 Tax=Halorubrum sp. HHNYT27 TaxID=3402275 RepID=UPI003EB78B62